MRLARPSIVGPVRGRVREGPVRVVYVGRATEERRWTLTAPAKGLVPSFVDHRREDVVERVSALDPDVVVVFGPERLERGAARAFPAVALAYLLDPVRVPYSLEGSPWRTADPVDGAAGTGPLGMADAFDVSEYDRIVAADPRIVRSTSSFEVWRSTPLPVDDALYRPAGRPLSISRPLFIGESTEYREEFLVQAKHHYDLRHYAFGLAGDRLAHVLRETTVGVVLPPGPFTTFEAAAPLHLAAGHLLVAGPLVPPRGLESGLDHLTFYGPADFLHLLFEIENRPAGFEVMRQRGRVRAEEFRASRIWPRLVRDLFLDLEAFGSQRD
jgi:hypothetical protein